MSSDVPEELVQSIEAFEEELAELKAELGPLLQSDNETLLETLSPLDRARLQVMTAYAVVSLYHAYLKTQGVSLSDHPLIKEMDRMNLYVNKLRQHQGGVGDGRPSLASRMVRNALFDPSQVTSKHQKRQIVGETEDNEDDSEEKATPVKKDKKKRSHSDSASASESPAAAGSSSETPKRKKKKKASH